MNFKNIIVKNEDDVSILVINRPQKLNAITLDTLREIEKAFKHFMDLKVRSIIISGEGRAFSAGADIAEMIKFDSRTANEYSKEGQRILSYIDSFPKPVLAVLNGYTFGGGCELALACDIRIAKPDIKIGLPEINLGIICGWGALYRLPRLIGRSMAINLLLSGKIVRAETAIEIGLIDYIYEEKVLMDKALKIAKNFSSKPPLAVSEVKKSVIFSMDNNLNKSMDFGAKCFSNCFKTKDQKEGMIAFLEKRSPIFKGV